MKTYTFDEALDRHFGAKGTPRRDKFEAEAEEALYAYKLGEAIKNARLGQNLTQEQLGEMIGVKKAQVSRIESGKNLTLSTIAKVFRAMGVGVSLDMAGVGKVSLW